MQKEFLKGISEMTNNTFLKALSQEISRIENWTIIDNYLDELLHSKTLFDKKIVDQNDDKRVIISLRTVKEMMNLLQNNKSLQFMILKIDQIIKKIQGK